MMQLSSEPQSERIDVQHAPWISTLINDSLENGDVQYAPWISIRWMTDWKREKCITQPAYQLDEWRDGDVQQAPWISIRWIVAWKWKVCNIQTGYHSDERYPGKGSYMLPGYHSDEWQPRKGRGAICNLDITQMNDNLEKGGVQYAPWISLRWMITWKREGCNMHPRYHSDEW